MLAPDTTVAVEAVEVTSARGPPSPGSETELVKALAAPPTADHSPQSPSTAAEAGAVGTSVSPDTSSATAAARSEHGRIGAAPSAESSEHPG